MAELERAEHNDEGRAREWMARALNAAPDPQWTADGHVSDRWLPVSPVSGRLDAFEWRVPLTGMVSAPVIEPEPPAATPSGEPPQPQPDVEPAPQSEDLPAAGAPTEDQPPTPSIALLPARRGAKPTQPKAAPVIPLVHAPDDPGPETIEETERPPEPQSGSWRKILE